MKARRTVALATAFLGAIPPTTALAADTYPTRPMRMIAPSSAGGPVDIIARIVAHGYTTQLGQQVVVDNRAGAAGLIGTDMASKAAADGYTMLFSFSGPMVIVPQLRKARTPYDSMKDFQPVSMVATAPYIMLAYPGVKAASMSGFIQLAKSQPGKLNYGSGGVGTGIHMAGALFNISAGTEVVHVPFKGAAPAMTALIAGQVSIMFNSLPAAVGHVKAGRVRALGLAAPKRAPQLPDLATAKEQGLDFEAEGWYGTLVPAGTAQAVVARLHEATTKALADASVRKQLDDLGVIPVGTTPAAFAEKMRSEWDKWGKVIRSAGLAGSL